MPSNIDLHIHSVYSDGSYTIKEIIDKAIDKKLRTIAIMDHDTLEARKFIPTSTSVNVLVGMETSTYDSFTKQQVHILAYQLKDDKHLNALVQPTLMQRKSIAYQQVKALNDHGIDLPLEKVFEKAMYSTTIYKQHILACLMEMGICDCIYSPFYYDVFKGDGYCNFPIYLPETEQVIKAIHQDGGIAILAHPFLSKVGHALNYFVKIGIDGIEVSHSSVTPPQQQFLYDYCCHNHLLMSQGSDCHGIYGNEPDIGEGIIELSLKEVLYGTL